MWIDAKAMYNSLSFYNQNLQLKIIAKINHYFLSGDEMMRICKIANTKIINKKIILGERIANKDKYA